MKSLFRTAVAAVVLAGTGLLMAAPADAQVGVRIAVPGIHVRVGAPAYYYGPGYYPPGPCDAYDTYYDGDCGYAVYNGPIYLGGVYVGGTHYYRWYGGHPYFWYRGGWHNWGGWNRVNFNWNRGAGWGWHDGHWDRGWGAAHWHGGAGWHGSVHGGHGPGGSGHPHP